MSISNQVLIVSGARIERKIYGKWIDYGPGSRGPGKKGPRKEGDKTPEQRAESTRNSINRARSNMFRICFTNSWAWKTKDGQLATPKFITYTFAENIKDPAVAHREFTKGMERLNYHWRDYLPDGLKYLVVSEKQRRGAIHYHQLVFNLPFIPMSFDSAREAWGLGRIKIDEIKNPVGLCIYLVKYMAKDLKSGRVFNGKRYFTSKGLLKPIIYRKPSEIRAILKHLPEGTKMTTSKIGSEYIKSVTYENYLLPYPMESVDKGEFFSAENDTIVLPTGTPADTGVAQGLHVDNRPI